MDNNFKPLIGKNVIETLTLGMYEDPRFIFREYIQNSADQIDIATEEGILNKRSDGQIDIQINSFEKSITIQDNATGIKEDKIRRFLGDVANSEKNVNTHKGFRGIGRLGGLGYCDRLIFETSYKGESVKSTMILNAKLLKDIIENINDTRDAASVISVITSITKTTHSNESHFFKVILENVRSEVSQDILEIENVRKYMSMVAPISFSPSFEFKDKIISHFKAKNFIFDEYNIRLNSQPVYKAYKNNFIDSNGNEESRLINVSFFDVKDENNILIGLGWYGISDGLNKVLHTNNIERGIRIKKNNITIGDETNLIPRFKTERTNLRYVGEIHVIGKGFIPNARRDYFNDNLKLKSFENALKEIFNDFESKLPHRASDLHNRLKNVQQFRDLKDTYNERKSFFLTQIEEDQRLNEVIDALETAETAAQKIDKIKTESDSNPQIKDLFNSIVSDYEYRISDEEYSDLYAEKIYPPIAFSKLNEDQSTILNEIVEFLQKELGYKQANVLIKKLQKKYN